MRVTDVWASKAAFEQFGEDQVRPAGEAVGMAEPEIDMYEVHAYMPGR